MKNKISDKSSPKLKEVAAAAKVSPTTASMVFSGKGRISQKTENTVLETAKQMGYIHPIRNSARKSKTGRVALLMLIDREWTFIWYFLNEMIARIELDLQNIGLNTVIIPVSRNEKDKDIYHKIISLECQAVFSIHFGKESLFSRLENADIPVILILNNNYQDKYFSICVDDFQGAYEGTRHLLNLGHTKIGFVDTSREDLPILSTDRYYGYRKALEEEKIEIQEDYLISFTPGLSPENPDNSFQTLMEGSSPPTALFCLDDEIALQSWSALTRIGYTIPGDISILAPGDVLDYSKAYIPKITTMHIDMEYVGRLAVDMLNNRLSNNINTVHVLKVKQQLISRGSCRKCSS